MIVAMTLCTSHLAAVLDKEPISVSSPDPPAPDFLLTDLGVSGVRVQLDVLFRHRERQP